MFVYTAFTTSFRMYCYFGFDVSSPDALKNQTCSTRQVSLSKTLLEPDQETSPAYTAMKVHELDDGGFHRQHDTDRNYHCYIFRYVSVQMLHDFQHESVHIEFGCDYNNLCHNKEIGKVLRQESVNGSHSKLFCCNTENCNTVNELPHLPAENRICYQGTDNNTEAVPVQKVSCVHPDIMCAMTTTYYPDGIVESYFCDNEKLCQDNMLPGSFRSCYQLLVDNTTQKICCCDASLCFAPPNSEGKAISVNTSSIADTRTVDSLPAEKTDKWALTGLVIALLFVTGIGGGIFIVVLCRKHKRPRPDPNVIMQYERLSASDVDVDDAVVL
ncbi:unnamed protein product [Candidula unifasciata]|uniref:Uncharacterized protein n=1 Tax=Candidula unifasciata TaxID=100452 RepID=A0A8S4A8T8_9EUPU|nr:unnamed protein product [Candidula unifasciata]